MILTIISAALGIISTITAWKLNPRRVLYAELDNIYKDLEEWYAKRNQALANHNSDDVTITLYHIKQLSNRKTVLFQRAGISNG